MARACTRIAPIESRVGHAHGVGIVIVGRPLGLVLVLPPCRPHMVDAVHGVASWQGDLMVTMHERGGNALLIVDRPWDHGDHVIV